MSNPQADQRDTPAGFAYGAGCYVLWGILPLYWNLLREISSFEVLIHRMLWCAVAMALFVAAQGKFWTAIKALKSRRLVLTLFATAILISMNWGVYVWSVATHQVVEVSLGYFITPLFVLAMGIFLLGEMMSPLRWIAVSLGIVAVLGQTYQLGHFPWIAVEQAVVFAAYGYLRKMASIGAMEGLFLESSLLLPFSVGLVSFWAWQGTGALGTIDWRTDLLLICAGPVTAVPLSFFTAAAQRLRFSTFGFMQYLVPMIAIYIAVTLFHERLTWTHIFTFACLIVALILLALDGAPRHWRNPVNWLRAWKKEPNEPVGFE